MRHQASWSISRGCALFFAIAALSCTHSPLEKSKSPSDSQETARDVAPRSKPEVLHALRQDPAATTFDSGAWSTAVGLGGGSGGRLGGRAPAPAEERERSTASYSHVRENPFLAVKDAPLSTFSVDVDTASYANVRRFLNEGQLPPSGAVRIEEMLNYFRYDYPNAPTHVPFSVSTEVGACPWNPGHRLVLVGLRGRELEDRLLPPRNLTFLLDVSGSMSPANRLPLVKQAMKLLVRQLRAQDHVAIVTYAGASGLALEPTSGQEQGRILAALEELRAEGSTNGASGIRLAYEVTKKHFDKEGINRVILATDGDFNVGTTSESELVQLIEAQRKTGVYLTVLGVGDDNLKDSAMKQLSVHGNGNYAYLDSVHEASKVLVREAGSTLVTIAKDVKLQIEFNPARVQSYRLIGYENRILAAKDFNDDQKDAGEIGAGHTVTALYEIVPSGVAAPASSVDPLQYQEPGALTARGHSDEILTLKLRYKEPDSEASKLITTVVRDGGSQDSGTKNLRLASALASFGMLLADSEHKGTSSHALVVELLTGLVASDHGERAELLGLVRRAAQLTKTSGTR